MKQVLCAAALLVLPAGLAGAATLPGVVTDASGNTSLLTGQAGTLTLAASSANGAATALYAWEPGGTVSQFSLDALFTTATGTIQSWISEGDEPALMSGSYGLTATALSFGGYGGGGGTYRTFSATFLTPFDTGAAPTVQQVLDVLNAGQFSFRIGNDITNGPGGPSLNYHATAEGAPTPAPVPLPATGWLLIAGAGALAAAGSRRRRT